MASQRERLIAATIAATARYGYREATIARIVAQAGVSRATFYENFADKEDCFGTTYRRIAGRIGEEMRQLEARRGGPFEARETLAWLLNSADCEPAGARLFLLEALAAGPVVRAEHEAFLEGLVESLDGLLGSTPADAPRVEIPVRALLGGIGNVIAIRVFRGETGRLAGLLDDLEAWLNAYRAAPGKRLSEEGWAKLGSCFEMVEREQPPAAAAPADPPASAAPVASEQRRRILAATAAVANEKGYAAMTVADIVGAAGSGREAFYEQFRNKQDAFLATQAYALEESVARSAASFFGEDAWPDRVWRGLEALLRYFSSVPDLANLDVVESYTAGAEAVRRSFDSRMAFTLFLEDGYRQRPEAELLPRLCSEAIAGAILEPMRHAAATGRVAETLVLVPQLAYLALAPFIGPDEALRQVEAKCAAVAESGS